MTVAPEVDCCRTCGAALKIIGTDDGVLTVECQDCGDVYAIEPAGTGRSPEAPHHPQLTEDRSGPDGRPR